MATSFSVERQAHERVLYEDRPPERSLKAPGHVTMNAATGDAVTWAFVLECVVRDVVRGSGSRTWRGGNRFGKHRATCRLRVPGGRK